MPIESGYSARERETEGFQRKENKEKVRGRDQNEGKDEKEIVFFFFFFFSRERVYVYVGEREAAKVRVRNDAFAQRRVQLRKWKVRRAVHAGGASDVVSREKKKVEKLDRVEQSARATFTVVSSDLTLGCGSRLEFFCPHPIPRNDCPYPCNFITKLPLPTSVWPYYRIS